MTLKNGSFLDIKGVYPSNGTPLGPVYVRNMLQTNETEYTENCQNVKSRKEVFLSITSIAASIFDQEYKWIELT